MLGKEGIMRSLLPLAPTEAVNEIKNNCINRKGKDPSSLLK